MKVIINAGVLSLETEGSLYLSGLSVSDFDYSKDSGREMRKRNQKATVTCVDLRIANLLKSLEIDITGALFGDIHRIKENNKGEDPRHQVKLEMLEIKELHIFNDRVQLVYWFVECLKNGELEAPDPLTGKYSHRMLYGNEYVLSYNDDMTYHASFMSRGFCIPW